MTAFEALQVVAVGSMLGIGMREASRIVAAELHQARTRRDHRVLCALSRTECQRADELHIGWGVMSSLSRLCSLGLVEMFYQATADGAYKVYRLTARGVRYRDVRDRAERELVSIDDTPGGEEMRRELAATTWLPEDATWRQIRSAVREAMECESTLVEVAQLLDLKLTSLWRRDVVLAVRLAIINAKLGARDADRYAMLQVAATAVLESMAIETAQHLPSCQCAGCLACLRLQKALAEARNARD